MKDIIKTILFLATLAPANVVLAATCVTSPSCEEMGYDKTAEDCEGAERLACIFDKNLFFCNSQKVKVGEILYSDMTTSTKLDNSKTPIGIVVNASPKVAMSLDEGSANPWGNMYAVEGLESFNDVKEALADYNGEANTLAIYDNDSSLAYIPVECYRKVTDGTRARDWYLPAMGELSDYIFANKDVINAQIANLGKLPLNGNGYGSYWSSTGSAGNRQSVWYLDYKTGDIAKAAATDMKPGRCIMKF